VPWLRSNIFPSLLFHQLDPPSFEVYSFLCSYLHTPNRLLSSSYKHWLVVLCSPSIFLKSTQTITSPRSPPLPPPFPPLPILPPPPHPPIPPPPHTPLPPPTSSSASASPKHMHIHTTPHTGECSVHKECTKHARSSHC
jgi:hypothetical protein